MIGTTSTTYSLHMIDWKMVKEGPISGQTGPTSSNAEGELRKLMQANSINLLLLLLLF